MTVEQPKSWSKSLLSSSLIEPSISLPQLLPKIINEEGASLYLLSHLKRSTKRSQNNLNNRNNNLFYQKILERYLQGKSWTIKQRCSKSSRNRNSKRRLLLCPLGLQLNTTIKVMVVKIAATCRQRPIIAKISRTRTIDKVQAVLLSLIVMSIKSHCLRSKALKFLLQITPLHKNSSQQQRLPLLRSIQRAVAKLKGLGILVERIACRQLQSKCSVTSQMKRVVRLWLEKIMAKRINREVNNRLLKMLIQRLNNRMKQISRYCHPKKLVLLIRV